ncbi:MAG TPA: hypothetical protein VJ843_01630 [Candidatus Saccharimonadales bacterium]|nr:hypothetical protein [Candidatus Saccharimonadales bacterium]
MRERALQAADFPSPQGLVGALQSYLRRTPGAPEYGSIGGGGYYRVVYGPLFTTFVLAQTCEIQGQQSDLQELEARSKEIHHNTLALRFDTGRIIPDIGRQILHEYSQNRIDDPHVEVARRLAVGLAQQDHESEVIAQDVQILLSRVALDGGFGEVVQLPDPANNLQAPIPDVA